MRFMNSPYRRCRKAESCESLCVEGYEWFLESWNGFNRYLWEQMDRAGRQPQRKFRYELPHMVKSPCEDCLCKVWCDRPCSQRLAWWDSRVVRKG